MAQKSSLNNRPLEIRWHGRGGQGAITAAKIIAQAAFVKGYKGVTAAPSFGAERRGRSRQRFDQDIQRTGDGSITG